MTDSYPITSLGFKLSAPNLIYTNEEIYKMWAKDIKEYTGKSMEELEVTYEMKYFIESSRQIIEELNPIRKHTSYFIVTSLGLYKKGGGWFTGDNCPISARWESDDPEDVNSLPLFGEHAKIADEICLKVFEKVMPTDPDLKISNADIYKFVHN